MDADYGGLSGFKVSECEKQGVEGEGCEENPRGHLGCQNPSDIEGT